MDEPFLIIDSLLPMLQLVPNLLVLDDSVYVRVFTTCPSFTTDNRFNSAYPRVDK